MVMIIFYIYWHLMYGTGDCREQVWSILCTHRQICTARCSTIQQPFLLLFIFTLTIPSITTRATTKPQHRHSRNTRKNPQRPRHTFPPEPIRHKPTPQRPEEQSQELRHSLDPKCLRNSALPAEDPGFRPLHVFEHLLCFDEEGGNGTVEKGANYGEESYEEDFVGCAVVFDQVEAD